MTTADPELLVGGRPRWAFPSWRAITSRLWWPERAFERARASGKAEDDVRLRIFFVMALFAAGFLTLSVWATHAALFSGLNEESGAVSLKPKARADLVDRNGEILAMDLVHYGLYIRPKEINDIPATRAALLAAIHGLSPIRLDNGSTPNTTSSAV